MQYKLIAAVLACSTALAFAAPQPAELAPRATSSVLPLCTRVKKTPKGDICNQKGSLSKPAQLKKYTNGQIYQSQNCADACGGAPACKSWSYDPEAETCTLYRKSLTAQGFTASSSSFVNYADIGCFSCSPCTQNTFSNGNFESGSISPWTCFSDTSPSGSYSCAIYSPGAGGSAHAAAITAPVASGEEPPDAQFVQTFQLCLGQSYQVSFDYATPTDAGGNLALSVTFGGQQIYQFQNFGPSNVNYTHVTSSVVTQNNQNAAGINFEVVNFERDGSVPVLIDNVVVAVA